MVKRNNKNIEELAKNVVDSWDMDDLFYYAIEQLIVYYKKDREGFEADWETMFGKEN